MLIAKGTVLDAGEIARIYQAAFPHSIKRFFAKTSSKRLQVLLELSFSLLFYQGAQAFICQNNEGDLIGYCLYSSTNRKGQQRDYKKILRSLPRLITHLRPKEALLLCRNQLILFLAQRRFNRTRGTAAILSLAIQPCFQGQGLGGKLLTKTLDHLASETVILNVHTSNKAGQRLYESAGFRVYGKTRDLSGEWLMLARPPSL